MRSSDVASREPEAGWHSDVHAELVDRNRWRHRLSARPPQSFEATVVFRDGTLHAVWYPPGAS